MSAKDIFEKLISRASYWWVLSDRQRRQGKPGEIIEKLSSEEREELQNLSSKDVEKHADKSILNYMIGQYPESTVRVFTHAIKKDNDE